MVLNCPYRMTVHRKGKVYRPWKCSGDHTGGHHAADLDTLAKRLAMKEHYIYGGGKVGDAEGPEVGDVEVLSGVVPAKMNLAVTVPKSAEKLAHDAELLGFDVEVLVHTEKRYSRTGWQHVDLVHVTGLGKSATRSAFHMRYENGKAGPCRIQVNGGSVQVLGITEARKEMLKCLIET